MAQSTLSISKFFLADGSQRICLNYSVRPFCVFSAVVCLVFIFSITSSDSCYKLQRVSTPAVFQVALGLCRSHHIASPAQFSLAVLSEPRKSLSFCRETRATRSLSVEMSSTVVRTMCRPNGTWSYWPAVQCRPPDHPRARRPARSPAGSVTDDRRRQTTPIDADRQQQTLTTVNSLASLHYV